MHQPPNTITYFELVKASDSKQAIIVITKAAYILPRGSGSIKYAFSPLHVSSKHHNITCCPSRVEPLTPVFIVHAINWYLKDSW